MNCKYCRANCTGAKQDREIALCLGYDPPKTNADRIRAMTDEELAELIGDNIDCAICKKEVFGAAECPGSIVYFEKDCYGLWLDWLRKEGAE